MSIDKPSFSKIAIPVSISLATEFFRESGDLPVSKFPATNELAIIVGKTLGADHDEYVGNAKLEAFIKTGKRPKRRPQL